MDNNAVVYCNIKLSSLRFLIILAILLLFSVLENLLPESIGLHLALLVGVLVAESGLFFFH